MLASLKHLFLNKRFIKFLTVGASGLIVNEGLLALLTIVFDYKVAIAGVIAIETSILTNFLLNNFWTWADNRHKPFFIRLLQYHSVAIIAGVVNYIILLVLSAFGMNHLLANLIGIACGTLINFLLNHFWTFGKSLRGKTFS